MAFVRPRLRGKPEDSLSGLFLAISVVPPSIEVARARTSAFCGAPDAMALVSLPVRSCAIPPRWFPGIVATRRECAGRVVIVMSDQRGPGRRPRSAKLRKFMELRERGLTIDAAALEVGVSRTAGRNRAND